MKRQKGKTKKLVVPCDAGHRSAGWTEEDFDERVLHRGAKIEFEHTRNPEVAERIAMDHLVEGKNYYEELEKMEKKLVPYKVLVPKPRVSKRCNAEPLAKKQNTDQKKKEPIRLTPQPMIKHINRFEDIIR